MKKFKNILLFIDLSLDNQQATEQAKLLAIANNASVTIFSVAKTLPDNQKIIRALISPETLESMIISDHRERLEQLVAEMELHGIKSTANIMTGEPFIEIIRQVLRKRHDLVIISAEDKNSLKERFFGSTAMHLMRKCPCPVWVVKPNKNNNYQRILAAVDVSLEAQDTQQESLNSLILQLASSMSKRDNSDLHIVQVWSLFGEAYMEIRGGLSDKVIKNASQETQHQYSNKLNMLLKSTDLKDITIFKHLLKDDDVASTIISLVSKSKIELLVMGTVCRTGVAGFFIGNTAEKVLSEVNCSVLTVKPDDFVTPITLEEA
jgi:universal stress protein E